MAGKTQFAGLEILTPGEDLSADGYAFQSTDRSKIDALLKIGCVTHRHDGHPAMSNPTTPMTLASASVGGSLPSDTPIYFCYTLIDPFGGETLPEAAQVITTGSGFTNPDSAPMASADYSAGFLLANTYSYAVTVTDGLGGETAIGPPITVTVDPGFASAQVDVSGLAGILSNVGGGTPGAQWRLWRSQGSGLWYLLATGTTDTFIDNGTVNPDCTVQPPLTGTTRGANSITVTVPGTAQPASAAFFNVYASLDGSFTSPALIATHPVSDFGVPIEVTGLSLVTGAPPTVSTCYPGANQINPDTDILDNTWKRPVATFADLPSTGNGSGDVRVVEEPTPTPYTWTTTRWVSLFGGAGSVNAVGDAHGGAVIDPSAIEFVGSGGATVDVADGGGGSAVVTVTAGGTPADQGFYAYDIVGGSGRVGGVAQVPMRFQGASGIVVSVSQASGAAAVVTISDTGGGGSSPAASGVGVGGSGHAGLVDPVSYIEFVGASGASASVAGLGGGSARVTISASGMQGPAGAQGAQGASGPPGSGAFTVTGSAGINPTLSGRTTIEFVGSGGTGVAVQDFGGGSAQVLISGGAGGSASSGAANWVDPIGPAMDNFDNLIGWSGDPLNAVGGSYVAQSSGKPIAVRVAISEAGTISTVHMAQNSNCLTPTTAQCYVGIYADGIGGAQQLLGLSGDISTQITSGANSSMLNVTVTAQSGQSLAVQPGQYVWVVVLINASTPPKFYGPPQTSNAWLALNASKWRHGAFTTAMTSLPSTLDFSGISAANTAMGNPPWVGVS